MRRFLAVLVVAPLLLALAACGQNTTGSSTSQSTQQAALAACTLYTASVRALAVAPIPAWLVSHPDQAAIVEEARTVLSGPAPGRTGGLCSSGTPAEGVAATIMTQVARLLTVQTTAQGAR